MRVINTLHDINLLHEAKVLQSDYLNYVKDLFLRLKDLLGYGLPIESFSLHEHGSIILLEKGDNVRDLSSVGLSLEDGGLLGKSPETLEVIELPGLTIFQLLVVYNNEYACFFLVPSDTFDQEVEAWLKEQSGLV